MISQYSAVCIYDGNMHYYCVETTASLVQVNDSLLSYFGCFSYCHTKE